MIQHVILFGISFILFLNGNEAKIAPDYIVPCKDMESDCLINTMRDVLPKITKGIPQIDIEPTDPFFQPHSKLELPGGFLVELTNSTLQGLSKCAIDSATFKDKVGQFAMHCNLTLKGQYKANGRILIVSINGFGDAKIKIKNASVLTKLTMEDVVRDGVTYRVVKDLKTTYGFGDKVTFYLPNLFQGNPQLSEVVLQFLNQNWKQVSEEFGGPIVDRMISVISNILKKFFNSIPKDELFSS